LAFIAANAIENTNADFPAMPAGKRAAVYQVLAVLMDEAAKLRLEPLSPKGQKLLRSAERSIDRAVRQVLAETIIVSPEHKENSSRGNSAIDINNCVLNVDPGKKRQITHVMDRPLDMGSHVEGNTEAYAALTRVDNVSRIEVFYFHNEESKNGFRPTCTIGGYYTRLSVTSVADVTLDPSGNWLIEDRPPGAADHEGGPRLRKLRWFQVCSQILNAEHPCRPQDLRWEVDSTELGQYAELQQRGRNDVIAVPSEVRAMAPMYIMASELDRDESAELDPDKSASITRRPKSLVRLTRGNARQFDPPEVQERTWGDDLLWDGQVSLSSVVPGFMISAYAMEGDLVAFVASARAPGAQRTPPEPLKRPCEGRELCTHVVRFVRLTSIDKPSQDISSSPVVEIRFTGPPIERIAFGRSTTRQGELLLKFAEVNAYATLLYDHKKLRQWMCANSTSKTPPADDYFSSAFSILKEEVGFQGSKQEMFYKACSGNR